MQVWRHAVLSWQHIVHVSPPEATSSWITMQVQSQFFWTRRSRDEISVDTTDGVVLLTMSAQTAEQKRQAEQLARATEGATRVVNRLHCRQGLRVFGAKRRAKSRDYTAARYFIAAVPIWILGTAAAWAVSDWAGLTPWTALAVFALLVVGDLLSYPRMRRYYRTEPPANRMIGQIGVAITPLEPDGRIRFGAEIWHAHLRGEPSVPAGTRVRVAAVNALRLEVEREPPAA
jgi:membrane protein implicated in regulation of membrane protease activity